ncbi:MAG TPA: hypothetical protein VFB20_10700 [Burkholderiales bacterium]|nr:hypothetical protein [Burkholderiales bacterium]
MIVDTIEDAQTVIGYVRATGQTLAGLQGLTKDELINGVRNGRAIVVVRAPDGFLLAILRPLNRAGFSGSWCVRWMSGAAQSTLRALALELAQELIRRGQGDVPVHWTQNGTIARFAATRLNARTITYEGVPLYWFTANEAVALL